MKYKIHRNGNSFCLGVTIAPYNDCLGACALYWNPEKKSFVDYATDCWRDYKMEDKIVAEFARIILFKEGTGIIL